MSSRSTQDRSAANRYLARRAEKTRLTTAPAPNLGLVVALPAFDEPDLSRTLKSLIDANSPTCAVEVIVLVNHPENASTALTERSKRLVAETHQWLQAQNCDSLTVHILGPVPLTAKHAGVGLARKTAMDEALRRLTDANAPNGIISCLDADCVVTTNYLQAIENKAKYRNQLVRGHSRLNIHWTTLNWVSTSLITSCFCAITVSDCCLRGPLTPCIRLDRPWPSAPTHTHVKAE